MWYYTLGHEEVLYLIDPMDVMVDHLALSAIDLASHDVVLRYVLWYSGITLCTRCNDTSTLHANMWYYT